MMLRLACDLVDTAVGAGEGSNRGCATDVEDGSGGARTELCAHGGVGGAIGCDWGEGL